MSLWDPFGGLITPFKGVYRAFSKGKGPLRGLIRGQSPLF